MGFSDRHFERHDQFHSYFSANLVDIRHERTIILIIAILEADVLLRFGFGQKRY